MSPATISLSGGKTSAYMLRRMMDHGALQAGVHVLFANTGKEREATLRFVRDVGERWGVLVVWLEYTPEPPGFREVTFATAARDGRPFEELITRRNFLPNPVMRFCTQELKIRVMREWMKAQGHAHWMNHVGIRADEPRRVARLTDPTKQRKERFTVDLPLVRWGVTKPIVDAYWAHQPFTLELEAHEGNCDLCFLKTADKRVAIATARPDLAAWWHRQEQRMGASFRKEGSLAEHIEHAKQRELDASAQGDLFTCFCGDDAEASA